ncbi:MAG: metallophosphoesterase family protein [Candidatus Aenigmatarchaeota archaeon]
MERKEIVSLFLKAGVLLRQEELEQLSMLGDVEIAEIAGAQEPKAELAKRAARFKFDVIKSLTSKPAKITAELQHRFLNSRYEKMKTIASQRIAHSMVSINRLPTGGEVFIAGIVRDVRESGKTIVEIEDPTGSVAVIFKEKPDVRLDEFVTVRATIARRIIFGKELLYPDIPIRKASEGNGRGCFISDLHLEEAPYADARRLAAAISAENVDWVFVSGDVGDVRLYEEIIGDTQTFVIPGEADTEDKYPMLPLEVKSPRAIALSNPAVIRTGGLNILLCHQFELSMLRKRHLGPSEVILEDDFLALDCVPDIVGHGHDHKPLVSNYKATTLVNAGSLLTRAAPVIVDFCSRQWKQLKV